jgi:hypothetical protein
VYVYVSNANFSPSGSNRESYPNVTFPANFPEAVAITTVTLPSLLPSKTTPNLLNAMQQAGVQNMLRRLKLDAPGKTLEPAKQNMPWDKLLSEPNPFSIAYLAMMHCVQRAIDAGLVKETVKPFPDFLELMVVPQRRNVNWEATLNDKILDPKNPASANMEQPTDYKSERGWGPRSKYWETIVTSAAKMSRDWLLDPETRTVFRMELDLIKKFGLKSQPVEDPLEFMLDVCTRMMSAPPADYARNGVLPENVSRTIAKILDELNGTRGPDENGNDGVGILYRVWHPRWQAMYPEDSIILGDKDNDWSKIEPAIQARPPLFPWYISSEHGGPLKADGDTSNAQTQDIEPWDFLPLKYRAYDSYFTHPDEQLVFYQKIIAAVEKHTTHRQYLPPTTWFDGYFLQRLSEGKWDVRQKTSDDKAWAFRDFGDGSGVKADSPLGKLYISQNELTHDKSADYYQKQLQTVIDEANFDGFDDARTEFWFRMYYMHKNDRPNALFLQFAHPPRMGKTRKFFRDLLNGIEKIEKGVASVVVGVAKTTAKVFIRSAGELTSSIIKDVGGELAPIARNLVDVGSDILSSFGIKWPANMSKTVRSAITIAVFAAIAFGIIRVVVLSLKKHQQQRGGGGPL